MNCKRPVPIAIPGGLLKPGSAEVARIWITDGAGSTVLIDAGVLADPFVFGHLLADTARHAAKAYAAAWSLDEGEALQAIVDGFGQELREQFNHVAPTEGSN